MTIIHYKRKFLEVNEIYGPWEKGMQSLDRGDIMIHHSLLFAPPNGPLVKKNKMNQPVEIALPNYIIDLSKDENEIYNNISKSYRMDIKKGLENDGFCFSINDNPTNEQLLNFSLYYNSFAIEKMIDKCVFEKLIAIRDNNSLVLTTVYDKELNVLVNRCRLIERDFGTVYCLYSASSRLSKITSKDKRLIGRANKCLYWNEIQTFKQRGYKWYNMGGYVNGKDGEGINDFKMKFGAIRGYEFKIYYPTSILGGLSNFYLYKKWKNYLNCK